MQRELTKRFLSSIILIPLVFYCVIKGSLIFNSLILILFFLTCYEWHNIANKKKYYTLGFIFLIISYSCVYYIRNNVLDNSLFLFILILITCIFSDLGGYIFGKLFKGPKLTKISPNKTISGAVGSLLFSAIILILIFFVFLGTFNFINIILGIAISISCQAGDLFFSFLKRKAKVKDSGNFFPGHGGVLDRLDGVFLGIPIGFIFMIYLN